MTEFCVPEVVISASNSSVGGGGLLRVCCWVLVQLCLWITAQRTKGLDNVFAHVASDVIST